MGREGVDLPLTGTQDVALVVVAEDEVLRLPQETPQGRRREERGGEGRRREEKGGGEEGFRFSDCHSKRHKGDKKLKRFVVNPSRNPKAHH